METYRKKQRHRQKKVPQDLIRKRCQFYLSLEQKSKTLKVEKYFKQHNFFFNLPQPLKSINIIDISNLAFKFAFNAPFQFKVSKNPNLTTFSFVLLDRKSNRVKENKQQMFFYVSRHRCCPFWFVLRIALFLSVPMIRKAGLISTRHQGPSLYYDSKATGQMGS